MPQFDLGSYIAKRQAIAGTDKTADLVEAKRRKLEQMATATSLAPTENTSWAGKLGLDGERLDGGLVNMAASLVSGGSRVMGQLASLPLSMSALADESSVSEEAIAAYGRYQQGKATPADMVLLNEAVQRPNAAQAKAGNGAALGESALQTLKDAAASRANARKVNDFFDLSGIVDQGNRDQLTRDLGSGFQEGWDKVTSGKPGQVMSGLADLIMNAGDAAINNPQAATEYVVENVPQLALGVLGKAGKAAMGASNVGYAADTYQKGIEEYQKQNNGALPDADERHKRMGFAATLAAAEQIGDMASIGMGKLGKLLDGGADATAKVAKTGIKQAPLNILKAALGGGATEAVTEGYQTYAEGKTVGKDASAQDIYTGGVIGGLAGAGLTGGMRAAAEAMQATPEHAEQRQVEAGKAAKFQQAVDKDDPSVFLDENSKDYDPVAAVRVMYAGAKKADATPEKQQQAQAKASEVITNLEQKHAELQDQYDSVSESGLKKTQALLGRLEERLKTTDPANTDLIAALNDGIATAKEQIAGYTDVIPANKKTAARLEKELGQLGRQLDAAREVQNEIVAENAAKVKPEQVEADLQLAESGDSDAVARIISLSMAMPSKLSREAAQKLASSNSAGLSREQRDYLRSFSAARQSENQLSTMRKVSQEILAGTPAAEVAKGKQRHLGIIDYRNRVGAAIAAGSQADAQRYLGLLENFRDDHVQKAAMAKQAYEQSVKDGIERQVLRRPDNAGWFVTTDLVSEKERVANGGLKIHPVQSKRLVPEMQVEVEALNNAHAELTAAARLHFGTGPVQSTSSTPAAPQAPTATPASPSGKQKKDTQEKNNSPQRTVKDQPRPSQGDGKSVAEEPQNGGTGKENSSSNVNSAPSSSSAAPAPVAAKAAPGSASSSTPAVGKVDVQAVNTTPVDAQKTANLEHNAAANSQAAQQPADAPAAAPAAEAAPAVAAETPVVPSGNNSQEEGIDRGEGIPESYFSTVEVPQEWFIKGEVRTTMEPANEVLERIREDLTNLETLLSCMKKG